MKLEQLDLFEHKPYSIKDPIKDQILTNIFNSLQCTSTRCERILRQEIKEYAEFLKYIGRERDFINLKRSGARTVTELQNLLKQFFAEYEKVKLLSKEESQKKLISQNFPYLNNKEIEFVYQYHKKENHYPLFYILCKYVVNSNNNNIQILSEHCGLSDGTKYSNTEIAAHHQITRERVRQILDMTRLDHTNKFLSEHSDWSQYNFLNSIYISPKTTNFSSLNKKEGSLMDFHIFCSLLKYAHGYHVVEINLADDKKDDKLSYCISPDLSEFRYSLVCTEIHHIISLMRKNDETLDLSEYINSRAYWIKKHDKNNENEKVPEVLYSILRESYGCEINDKGILLLTSNKMNIGKEVEKILREHGHPMSVDEIFYEFKKIHPDHKYTESRQLRPTMSDKSLFKAIGRRSVYALADSDVFSGIIPDFFHKILDESPEPLSVEEICRQTMAERPHSTEKSIRCYISIDWNHELVRFNGGYIGLKSKLHDYDTNKFTLHDNLFSKRSESFERKVNKFRDFITQNRRMPRKTSSNEEARLYYWFSNNYSRPNMSEPQKKMMEALCEELDKMNIKRRRRRKKNPGE